NSALHECLGEETETSEHERRSDHLRRRRLRPVPVAALEVVRDLDSDQRHGARAEEHPEREPGMHRAEVAMTHGAERLEDRTVEDVRADGECRSEAEDE